MPTITLPNDSLAGLGATCPAGVVVVVVPEPLREMAAVGFEASLTTVAVALNAPVALGAKVIPIDVFCPPARVTGRVGEVNKKSWLVRATLRIVIEVLPEFVAVKVVPLVLPTATLPKLTLELPKVRLLGSDLVVCWLGLPALNPWQPTRKARAKSSESAPAADRRSLPESACPRFSCIVSHGTMSSSSRLPGPGGWLKTSL